MDFIADMITRIRNAQLLGRQSITLHSNTPKICVQILIILRQTGHVLSVQKEYDPITKLYRLRVFLKYGPNGEPCIRSIFRVSKQGNRVHTRTNTMWKARGILGLFILSIPFGILTDTQARRFNVGGEVLLGVY